MDTPKFKLQPHYIVILLIAISLSFIFRDVFLKNKIIFPSNFLASFYAPWSTHLFSQFPNGIPNKPIGGNDQVRMFYPYRTFSTESLVRGELPLWNPYNFSGSPILANFQSAVLYPLNLIYLILPQITAWSLLVIVQPILGTIFMYMFLKIFIPRKSAALLGAFSFGFSGFILAWSQENAVVGQAALWLPAVLYTTEKFIHTKYKKYFILLVLTLVSCFFAGHYQTTYYIFITTIAYGLMRIWQNPHAHKKKFSLVLIGAYILMLLICAVQLIPSVEAFTQSPRSSVSPYPIIKAYLMPATHFIVALAPDIFGNPGSYNYFGRGFYQESVFYAGTIPVIFALLAAIKLRKSRLVQFFTATLILSYICGIDSPITHWFNQLPIPVITTFTPSRIFFLTSAAISVLSAFGFNYWIEEENGETRNTIYSIAAIGATAIFIITAIIYSAIHFPNPLINHLIDFIILPGKMLKEEYVTVTLRNIVLPLAMLVITCIAVFIRRKVFYIPLVIVALVCFGQLYFYNKYLVLGEKSLLYPDHFIFTDIQNNQNKADRFLSFGRPILSDVGLQKHVYSPDGIDPVFSSRYGQLLYATKIKGKFTWDTPRIEANLSEYGENLNIIDNPMRLRLISLLGVTRIYNYEPGYKNLNDIDNIFPPGKFTRLWNREGWTAYQNASALPRAFLASNYVIEPDRQKSIDFILSSSTDLRNTIVLEEKLESFVEGSNSKNSTAQIKTYTPQRVEIAVKSDSDKLLFLSDNYYPGWKAYRGSEELKIYRADYAFRAVLIPKGENTITFIFQPRSVQIGIIISLMAILFLALLWLKPVKQVSGLRNQ
jgi:hypothetical protein